jgi:hypothetical protein
MAESNKLTNILLGAAIVTLGYAIYQTYPNEITANADTIKNKLKGLFGKKTKSNIPAKDVSTCSCGSSECNCHKKDLSNAEHLNIYVQEEAWNDLPSQVSTDVICHYNIDNSIGEKAVERMNGYPNRS